MRRFLIGAVISALVPASALGAPPDFARIFQDRDACFALYDLKADRFVTRYNEKNCAERTSPCSTFKVPLSLMAFDADIWKDETTPIPWDGTRYSRDSWNGNQTPASWMANSVVWVSQRLTPRLGGDRVNGYLTRFDFGNRDMSGGLTKAWLMSSLKISPDEEIAFWKKLWREQLPVSKHAYAVTKKITFVETSPGGWTLHGKTGSGSIGEKNLGDDTGYQLGWFVGRIARGDREYLFVTRFSDRKKDITKGPAGWEARDMSKEILKVLGLY